MQTKCVIEWDVPAPNWAGARTGGNLSVLDAPSPSVLDGAVGSAAREDARARSNMTRAVVRWFIKEFPPRLSL